MDLLAIYVCMYQFVTLFMELCRLACSVVYYAIMVVADFVEMAREHDAYQFSPTTLKIVNAILWTAFICAVFMCFCMCYAAVSIGRYRPRLPALDA